MTPREERLLALELRAEVRRKRRKVLGAIAYGFGRTERGDRWWALCREADALAVRLWGARVEAGTRRWQADDERGVLVAVEP